MTRAGTIVFVTAAFLAVGACNRSSKSDPRAALDDAFRAGLLTKDEYDAKRADNIAASAASASATAAAVAKAPAAIATNAAPTAPATPAPAANASAPASAPPAPGPQAVSSTPKSVSNAPQPNAAAEDKIAAAPAKEKILEAAPGITQSKEPAPAPLKGCEDDEFKSGGQKSESRFFAASPEAVHRAAVSALESMDFNIRKNTGKEIEANRKRHIGVIVGAGGERVTLTFRKQERNGQSGTSVTGETRKSFVGRLAQRTWTDAVLAQMACKLRDGR